jgi:chromosome segregation ATPase
MFQSAQIAELKEANTKLEADLAKAAADNASAQAEAERFKASATEISAAADVLKASLGKALATMKGLRAKLVAIAGADVCLEAKEGEDESETEARACAALADQLTSKATVDAQVTERLASAGTEPIKRDPQAKEALDAPVAGLSGIAKSRAALAAKSKK